MKRANPKTRKPPAAADALVAMQRNADEAVAVLKGLASRNRLLLLCQLVDGERSVGDLAKALGLAQSAVSQHLSLLRREGVVAGRRDAQSILYRICDPRVNTLMATMFALFCRD